jgi:hypothetical protein
MDDRNDDWVEERPKRRGLPRWMWFTCGCTSFLALAGAVALYFGGKALLEKGTDPELQWPRLDQVLPFEERPEHLALEFGMSMPMEQFVLRDERTDVRGIVYASTELEAISELFETKPSSAVLFGLGSMIDPEEGEIEIQGKSVRSIRFRSIKGTGNQQLGPGVRLDLGTRGDKHVAAELRRPGKAPSDEEVQSFLEGFQVWSDE